MAYIRRLLQLLLQTLPIDSPIDRAQAPLVRNLLIANIIGGLLIAPVSFSAGGPALVPELLLLGSSVLICFSLVGLLSLRRGAYRPAVLVGALGLLISLSMALAALGTDVGLSLLLAFALPLSLVALLASRLLMAISAALVSAIITAVLLLERSAPSLAGLVSDQEMHTPNLIASVLIMTVLVSFFLYRSGTALRRTLSDLQQANALLSSELAARRQVEAQLIQAQKLESIGKFAGSIAHDFNNFLTIISGTTEFARASLPADHIAHADMEVVLQTTRRAANLTRQLLTFARRQESFPEELDLRQLIAESEPMLRRLVRANITLTITADADLPQIWADPTQIGQVLTNLVVNASDAMPDGGTLTVSTAPARPPAQPTGVAGTRPVDRCVLLTVRDTGLGMSEEVQRQAFDPFFSTKGPGRGTGLGLAICYGIIRQSGGVILIDSAPGQGTAMQIYLPAAPSGAGGP